MVKRYFNMVDTGDTTEPDMFPKDVQAYTHDVGLMNGIPKVLKYVRKLTAAARIFPHYLLAIVFFQDVDLPAADGNETTIVDDGIRYLDNACDACLF
jgi:hypothetical protein